MMGPPPEDAAATGEADELAPVRALAPLVAGGLDEMERERRLPQRVVDAMIEARLFRLLLPRPYGGDEVDPPHFLRTIEALAMLDASTAWVLCQTAICAMTAAFLPREAAAAIWRDPRAILAWGPGPGARAVAVDGGYRVSGTWSFASGGRHATWLGATACPIHEADGTPRRTAAGKPVTRTLIFPASAVAMIDMWNVIGLKGTGSDGYTVTDLFVPESHVAARDDPASRVYPGRLYSVSTYSMHAAGFAALALGVARGLLDGFVGLATEKTPRGFRPLRQEGAVQSDIAQAEAQLRAARMYLFGTVAELWDAAAPGGVVPLARRMDIRLAATHVIREACAVADIAYDAAGTTAIFPANGFERRFRDMHTVAQQVQGRKSHYVTVGQHILGLDPDPIFV